MQIDSRKSFLIVEDELLIAEHISGILNKAGYINSSIAMNVDEAIVAINTNKPDLVLTDITLGFAKTGIDLGKLLNEKYKIPFIYITSHSSPDILFKAKQTHPNSYLVKPFKKEDILVAIELALFNAEFENAASEEFSLTIKDGHALARIPHKDILWLEADGNYTAIHTVNSKKRLVRNTISELLEQLHSDNFLRIHKSYVINKAFVTELHSAEVVLKDTKLPIGRTYRETLLEHLK